MKQYDVAIIGAGVVGASIARTLSRYALKIALLDARGTFPWALRAPILPLCTRDTTVNLARTWPA